MKRESLKKKRELFCAVVGFFAVFSLAQYFAAWDAQARTVNHDLGSQIAGDPVRVQYGGEIPVLIGRKVNRPASEC